MPFGLLIHDWSKLTFAYAASKRNLTQLTHVTDVGYELTTALLVSGDDGSPLAPTEMHLKTADGVLSTRKRTCDLPHIDQVLPTMKAARTWNLAKPLLHVIDREADSVDHYRQWELAGYRFLVRGDDRRVKWNGEPYLLSEIRHAAFEEGIPLRRERVLPRHDGRTVGSRDVCRPVSGRQEERQGPKI